MTLVCPLYATTMREGRYAKNFQSSTMHCKRVGRLWPSIWPADSFTSNCDRRSLGSSTTWAPAQPLPRPLAPAAAAAAAGDASADVPLHNMNLRQAISALSRQTASGEVQLEELQPLAERCLALANDSGDFQELADLAEAFAEARLRLPLRDLMPAVSARLRDQPDRVPLPSVIRLLTATGRASLFYIDLFEFCGDQLSALSPGDLATYLYEGGRHGLRCRHFLDAALGRAVELAPQMSLGELMRAWQGLIRFSRDRRDFYKAALPRVRAELGRLVAPHLLLAMRVARDLKNLNEFIDLHAACATELIMKMDSLSLAEGAQCLAMCGFSMRYRAQAQALVRSVEQKWNGIDDLTPLRVVEVVDALQTLASWSMKPMPLVDRLDSLLIDRQVELKYSGNVSLWVVATQALARMEHVTARWPLLAMEFARDPLFVEKISFYQQCDFLVALGRLRIFDELAYKNVADLIVSDFTLFKQVQDLAPVLWTCATVNYVHKDLFDSAYDLMVSWLEAEQLDLSQRTVISSMIQAAWSFAVAGYHTRYESFAAFLDYAVFPDLGTLRIAHMRRLAQLSDTVLTEAPNTAGLCQYPDRLEAARRDQRVRGLVTSDPTCDPELLQDIRTTLQQLGWQHEAFFMPDECSTFYVDISLAQKTGQKVGLLLAGRYELLAVGLPGEVHPPREAGIFSLARRLHAQRGWRTAVIDRSSWSALSNVEQKRAYLEEAVQRALKEPLPTPGSNTAAAAAGA
mmetsp:Transcript_65239/g.190892  ORF Transcript_65239/g.190892 Transcript_65239/m.190892 type:complete len:743 (-) Transcript_65239:125-2353(-)